MKCSDCRGEFVICLGYDAGCPHCMANMRREIKSLRASALDEALLDRIHLVLQEVRYGSHRPDRFYREVEQLSGVVRAAAENSRKT